MPTLRCTAKLLKAMKAQPVADPPPPQNRLGEWTANLIRFGRRQYVIAVNDQTRLGLMIDAAPYAGISGRFTEQLLNSLLWLDIPPEEALAEAAASRPTAFARSNSASVLSTLTRFALDMDAHWYHHGVESAPEFSRRLLREIVCRPKHIGCPADRVRELFGLPPEVRHRAGPQADHPAAPPPGRQAAARGQDVGDPSAPLSPTELRALEQFLQQPGRRDRAMNLAMLEGYLAAVVIAPSPVMPSDWLPRVWDIERGTRAAGFATAAEAQRVLGLVMRLYNGVAQAFAAEPFRFEPLYRRDAGWDVRHWCEGVLIGLDFDADHWRALMRREREWFTPFVRLGSGADLPAPEDESRNLDHWKEIIPSRLLQMREDWRRPSPRPMPHRAPEKTGRNEACPCGSGRKFKKCCGGAPTLH